MIKLAVGENLHKFNDKNIAETTQVGIIYIVTSITVPFAVPIPHAAPAALVPLILTNKSPF